MRCCAGSRATCRSWSRRRIRGLHVLAWLPPDVDESGVVSEARRRGVHVDGLAGYLISRADTRGALIFGYGNVSERAIDQGTRAIATALAAARS